MEALFYYLAIGVVSGFLSGLFGIGGGLIVVPMLAGVLPLIGFEYQIMQYATATSLAVMIFTASTSTLAHYRRKCVDVQTIKLFSVGGIIGGLLGRYLAHIIPSLYLAIFFVISLYAISISMVLETRNSKAKVCTDSWQCKPQGLLIVGSLVGFLAGMLGIGGGILIVPYLVRCGAKMVQAVGTAAGCGLIVAVNGTIGSIIFGADIDMPYCIGYIVLPAAACIAITGIPAATIGAYLAHNSKDVNLKIVFAFFLIIIATTILSQFI